MSGHTAALALISLVAAVVNGALGYGFSSISVPLALRFLSNRVLNPAIVLVELALNVYVLWVNRAAIPLVRRRVLPVVAGLLPGVLLGTMIVSRVSPGWLRFVTYLVLLPLVLLQVAGYRRPIRNERSAGPFFGAGLGVLYAVTPVPGPPLVVVLNNPGLGKHEFRAALGLIRLTESVLTAMIYALTGFYSHNSIMLVPQILLGVLIGAPIGVQVVRHVRP